MRDLSRIDWNLVPTLDALLTERNVSRAARRLGITQPTTSAALGRLRRYFDDELLVRYGNRYVLTPLAEQLAPLARDAVSSTTRALASAGTFDPAASTREFSIGASDYVQAVLGRRLARAFTDQAPRARLVLASPFSLPYGSGADIVAQTDGWLAPREVMPGQCRTGLLKDDWVCVAAADHPSVGDVLELDHLRDLSWVAPTIRGQYLRLHLDGLSARGIEPQVAISTQNFTNVPFLVAGTPHVGIMQASLAHALAGPAGVRIHPCPWPVQPLHLTFWWDPRREPDPAHAWLRSVVAQCLSEPWPHASAQTSRSAPSSLTSPRTDLD